LPSELPKFEQPGTGATLPIPEASNAPTEEWK